MNWLRVCTMKSLVGQLYVCARLINIMISSQRSHELKCYDRLDFTGGLSHVSAPLRAWSCTAIRRAGCGYSGAQLFLSSCSAAQYVQTMREFQFLGRSDECLFQLSGLFNDAVIC